MSTSSTKGRQEPVTMDETLARAKAYMQSSDYSRAIVLLQRARNMCKCISVFREKNKTKEHSSAKVCLRDSLLSAALSDDENDGSVFKAATSPCSCGVPKLSCEDGVHMDVLDKLAACSAAMGKNEAAIGFAAAAIHLNPKSPVGYCRLSKLIRTRKLDEATLRSDVDNEVMALAIVRHGVFNVKTYGDIQHPLYQVLRVISRKLYRKDPLKVFPPELKVMILSQLDTLSLVRCHRVCKGWLFAIRDDPNLFLKLVFIFTGKYKPDRITKGMLKVINRSKRASTLSISPAIFTSRQYELIFSHLKDLRHLHLQSEVHSGFDDTCAHPPTQLTRLTFVMPPQTHYTNWLMSLVKASASTLEELQASVQINIHTADCLPRLRVLRIHDMMSWPWINLDLLGSLTPNLEQLCLEGIFGLTEARDSSSVDSLYPISPRWPKLKTLVLNCQVSIFPRLDRLVPPGIQVLDLLGEFDGESFFEHVDESKDWAELRFFRCRSRLEPEKLSRILGPSLGNGKLKTLSLTIAPDELDKLPFASQHIQALGLVYDVQPSMGTFVRPRYLDWVARFPNAHTFAVTGSIAREEIFLAALVLRPGTKTIFEGSLFGFIRDKILEEAEKRNVNVIRSDGFPVVFPWRVEDDGTEGGARLVDYGDVAEQWKNARGMVTEGSFRASNQPFFRE